MNYRTERLPVVTFILIAINSLVLAGQMIWAAQTDGASSAWVMSHLWLTPSQSVWYSYLTSMFVHAGILHLLGNMIFLFLFGCCVEDLIGRWRFLFFYLLGGLAAELAYIAVSPLHFASHVPMGGASGAISASMGMYSLLRANAEIEFKYFYFFWLLVLFRVGSGEFEVPAWMAIGFWFLKDLVRLIWSIYHPSRFGGGVAFGAHVGGLLAGLALLALWQYRNKIKAPTAATANAILSPEEIRAAASFNKAPEPRTILLHENGVQTGPHTLSEIQARLEQKELDDQTIYWKPGMSRWENVMDLAEAPPDS